MKAGPSINAEQSIKPVSATCSEPPKLSLSCEPTLTRLRFYSLARTEYAGSNDLSAAVA